MKVLECSSAGDKRFSALVATVTLFGKEQTIEEWYQFSKRLGPNGLQPNTWKEVKFMGRWMKPTACVVNEVIMDIRFLTPWYKFLWLIYLDDNPKLVEYADEFDGFHDKFKGSSFNSQADVIKQYVKEGRESLYKDCEELMDILDLRRVVDGI